MKRRNQSKGGKKSMNRGRNVSQKRRNQHRGGNGKSAYHHTIAMVGDAETQLRQSLESAYN